MQLFTKPLTQARQGAAFQNAASSSFDTIWTEGGPWPLATIAGHMKARFETLSAGVSRVLLVRRTRRELSVLDDRMLSDIGLTRSDAIHWGIAIRDDGERRNHTNTRTQGHGPLQ